MTAPTKEAVAAAIARLHSLQTTFGCIPGIGAELSGDVCMALAEIERLREIESCGDLLRIAPEPRARPAFPPWPYNMLEDIKLLGSVKKLNEWAVAIQDSCLRLSGEPRAPGSFADFAAWLCREMPAGTVIADPLWWAPRIMKAAHSSGEPGEQSPAWMIAFEDKDCGSVVFTGDEAETAARKAFGRASVTMTCRLYRCVTQSGYGPQPQTNRDGT